MSENRRILVVDDEPQITRVLRRSLTAHRYDVRVAADGEAGTGAFNDWHPDLVVTDLSIAEHGRTGILPAAAPSLERSYHCAFGKGR